MKNFLFIAITIALLLSSCSNINVIEAKNNKVSSINFFKDIPPRKGESRVYHQALTSGYLVVKNNCLYLERKKESYWGKRKSYNDLTLLIWPWDFSLKNSNQGIHVINGSQKVFAKVGGYYHFGGSGNYKNNSPELLKKYKKCFNVNVTGYWGVSPERINRHSATRKALKKYMLRRN